MPVIVEQNLNLLEYPRKTDATVYLKNQRLTSPDMHGTILNPFHFLIRRGLLMLAKTREESVRLYKRLVTIYTNINSVIAHQAGIYIEEFTKILKNSFIQVEAPLLHFLGDIIADRGGNDKETDYGTDGLNLIFFEHIKARINYSNHDDFALRLLTALPENNIKAGKMLSGYKNSDFRTIGYLGELLQKNIIDVKRVKKLVESYQSQLIAIDVSYDKEAKTLTFFTHAPVGFETIKALAKLYGIDYQCETAEKLLTTIHEINKAFVEQVTTGDIYEEVLFQKAQFDKLYPKKLGSIVVPPEYPLLRLIWNRGFLRLNDEEIQEDTTIELPEALLDGTKIFLKYGHDGVWDRNLKPNMECLEGDLGKRSLTGNEWGTNNGEYDPEKTDGSYKFSVLTEGEIKLSIEKKAWIDSVKQFNEIEQDVTRNYIEYRESLLHVVRASHLEDEQLPVITTLFTLVAHAIKSPSDQKNIEEQYNECVNHFEKKTHPELVKVAYDFRSEFLFEYQLRSDPILQEEQVKRRLIRNIQNDLNSLKELDNKECPQGSIFQARIILDELLTEKLDEFTIEKLACIDLRLSSILKVIKEPEIYVIQKKSITFESFDPLYDSLFRQFYHYADQTFWSWKLDIFQEKSQVSDIYYYMKVRLFDFFQKNHNQSGCDVIRALSDPEEGDLYLIITFLKYMEVYANYPSDERLREKYTQFLKKLVKYPALQKVAEKFHAASQVVPETKASDAKEEISVKERYRSARHRLYQAIYETKNDDQMDRSVKEIATEIYKRTVKISINKLSNENLMELLPFIDFAESFLKKPNLEHFNELQTLRNRRSEQQEIDNFIFQIKNAVSKFFVNPKKKLINEYEDYITVFEIDDEAYLQARTDLFETIHSDSVTLSLADLYLIEDFLSKVVEWTQNPKNLFGRNIIDLITHEKLKIVVSNFYRCIELEKRAREKSPDNLAFSRLDVALEELNTVSKMNDDSKSETVSILKTGGFELYQAIDKNKNSIPENDLPTVTTLARHATECIKQKQSSKDKYFSALENLRMSRTFEDRLSCCGTLSIVIGVGLLFAGILLMLASFAALAEFPILSLAGLPLGWKITLAGASMLSAAIGGIAVKIGYNSVNKHPITACAESFWNTLNKPLDVEKKPEKSRFAAVFCC